MPLPLHGLLIAVLVLQKYSHRQPLEPLLQLPVPAKHLIISLSMLHKNSHPKLNNNLLYCYPASTTSLSGNTWTNNPHPQVFMPDNNSVEMLPDICDKPPINALPTTTNIDNHNTSTINNLYTTNNEPLFNAI